MIRKILVPVRGDGKGDNVLAHAAALAKRSEAHIEVVHCRPRPEDLRPFGVPLPGFMDDQLVQHAAALADQEEAKLKNEFVTLTSALGLSVVEKQTSAGSTASWVEGQGKMVDVIKQRGRLSDLIAVAKPDRDRNLGMNTLKAALFNTARPVMMCPPEPPNPALGSHVAIAWNGSTEAVRAVVMMRRLVEAADRVTILTSGQSPDGTTAQDLKDYLNLRNIASELHAFDDAGNTGQEMLRAAQNVGADVMLMGAYGQSHERETVFGGNTQTIVDASIMPVVFVH